MLGVANRMCWIPPPCVGGTAGAFTRAQLEPPSAVCRIAVHGAPLQRAAPTTQPSRSLTQVLSAIVKAVAAGVGAAVAACDGVRDGVAVFGEVAMAGVVNTWSCTFGAGRSAWYPTTPAASRTKATVPATAVRR